MRACVDRRVQTWVDLPTPVSGASGDAPVKPAGRISFVSFSRGPTGRQRLGRRRRERKGQLYQLANLASLEKGGGERGAADRATDGVGEPRVCGGNDPERAHVGAAGGVHDELCDDASG